MTEFYRNEYSYFLRYVLGLQEELRLRPDARGHGNFLHRIFERALQLPDEDSFDQRLEQAIQETSQEREFEAIYQESLEAQFTKEVLLDVHGRLDTFSVTIQLLKPSKKGEFRWERAGLYSIGQWTQCLCTRQG